MDNFLAESFGYSNPPSLNPMEQAILPEPFEPSETWQIGAEAFANAEEVTIDNSLMPAPPAIARDIARNAIYDTVIPNSIVIASDHPRYCTPSVLDPSRLVTPDINFNPHTWERPPRKAKTSKSNRKASPEPLLNRSCNLSDSEDAPILPKDAWVRCGWEGCHVEGRAGNLFKEHVYPDHVCAGKRTGRDDKISCLWEGCTYREPLHVASMLRHVGNDHLQTLLRRCIYCGSQGRNDSYLRKHGLAKYCRKNPALTSPFAPDSPSPDAALRTQFTPLAPQPLRPFPRFFSSPSTPSLSSSSASPSSSTSQSFSASPASSISSKNRYHPYNHTRRNNPSTSPTSLAAGPASRRRGPSSIPNSVPHMMSSGPNLGAPISSYEQANPYANAYWAGLQAQSQAPAQSFWSTPPSFAGPSQNYGPTSSIDILGYPMDANIHAEGMPTFAPVSAPGPSNPSAVNGDSRGPWDQEPDPFAGLFSALAAAPDVQPKPRTPPPMGADDLQAWLENEMSEFF